MLLFGKPDDTGSTELVTKAYLEKSLEEKN